MAWLGLPLGSPLWRSHALAVSLSHSRCGQRPRPRSKTRAASATSAWCLHPLIWAAHLLSKGASPGLSFDRGRSLRVQKSFWLLGRFFEPLGGELGCQFAESLRASLVELTSLALTYVQRMLAGYMDKDSSCKPCRSRGVSLSQVFCHGGKRTSGRVTPRPSGLSRLRSPGRVCSRGTRRPREVPREIVLTLRRLGESPGTALRACRPAAWRTSAAMAKHSRKRETEEPRMSTCSHGRGKPHNLSKEALLEQGEP